MFESLTGRLQGIVRNLTGAGRLTPDNVRDQLRDVRRALLEADVELTVARDFVARVETRAVGEDVLKSLTPGQQVVGIVRDELVALLGRTPVGLAGSPHLPTVVLLAGLQGSGKTTFAGKLALWLGGKSKKVMLASADVYRPAAIEQLEVLAQQAGAAFWRAPEGTAPLEIARQALEQARRRGFDFLIFDTAGRLHVDEALMEELAALHRTLGPHQVLLVMDGMTGQEAVRVGRAFTERIGVDGLVLTKMDGDARGGAALSLRQATGKPILFLGVGEKLEGLEAFDPGRLAQRILGMGDVIGLVERARAASDEATSAKLAESMRRSDFTLDDFLLQLRQMRKMGSLEDVVKMLPGVKPGAVGDLKPDEERLGRFEAIMLSMTPRERRHARLFDASRRRRVAAGSGTSVRDVNELLREFERARTVMRHLKKGRKGLGALRAMMR